MARLQTQQTLLSHIMLLLITLISISSVSAYPSEPKGPGHYSIFVNKPLREEDGKICRPSGCKLFSEPHCDVETDMLQRPAEVNSQKLLVVAEIGVVKERVVHCLPGFQT
jgi:hypothetical protein